MDELERSPCITRQPNVHTTTAGGLADLQLHDLLAQLGLQLDLLGLHLGGGQLVELVQILLDLPLLLLQMKQLLHGLVQRG